MFFSRTVIALYTSCLMTIALAHTNASADSRVKVYSTQPYGVICIRNRTGRRIGYQAKWGSSYNNKTYVLNPGHAKIHSYRNRRIRYKTYKTSPNMHISFVSGYGGILGNKIVKNSHILNPGKAHTKSCKKGRIYDFKNRGRRIKLFDVKPIRTHSENRRFIRI